MLQIGGCGWVSERYWRWERQSTQRTFSCTMPLRWISAYVRFGWRDLPLPYGSGCWMGWTGLQLWPSLVRCNAWSQDPLGLPRRIEGGFHGGWQPLALVQRLMISRWLARSRIGVTA